MLTRIVDHAFRHIDTVDLFKDLRNVTGKATGAASNLDATLPLNAIPLPTRHELIPIAAPCLVEISIGPGGRALSFAPRLRDHAKKRVFLAPGLPFLVRAWHPAFLSRNRHLHP